MRYILFFCLIICVAFVHAQRVNVGTPLNPSILVLNPPSDSSALIWDNGGARLNNNQDALSWNRAKFRLLLDADNNTTAKSEFSIYSGANTGSFNTPVVNFNLDGGQSWINSGNFGIGTTVPTADLEILGVNNTNAIEWDSGGTALRHHYDMLRTDRGWMRLLIDADNDYENAHFAIYNNKSASSGTPPIRFHLDGDHSWIGPGNLGIGTITPDEKLEVVGAIKLGNTSNLNPAEGTIRWNNTASDFQGFDGNTWKSLISNTDLKDADGDTKVEVDDGTDSDDVSMIIENELRAKLSKNAVGRSILSFPNNNGNIILGSTGNNSIQSGENNIFLGPSVGLSLQNSHENILIGKQNAALSINTDSSVYIGNSIGLNIQTGQNNVAIGHKAMWMGIDAQKSVVIGDRAGENIESARSVIIGSEAGKDLNRDNAVIIGYRAGELAVILGDTANSERSVMIGDWAGNFSEGKENVMVGSSAGSFTHAAGSVMIGRQAQARGDEAIAIGKYAGNPVVGYGAADGSVFIGAFTHATIGVGGSTINSIAIGHDTGTEDNHAVIGNSAFTSIGGFTGWSNISDGRIKKNVNEEIAGLYFINALRPVSYTVDYHQVSAMNGEQKHLTEERKNSNRHIQFVKTLNEKSNVRQTGFIAQEVDSLVHQLDIDFNGVDHSNSEMGLMKLRYAEFVPHLVKAIQEQQSMLKNKEDRIQALEDKVNILLTKMESLDQ